MNRLTFLIILLNISLLSGFVVLPTIMEGSFIFTQHIIVSIIVSFMVFLTVDFIIYMINIGDPFVIRFILDCMHIFLNEECCRDFCECFCRSLEGAEHTSTSFAKTVRR